MTRFNKRFIAGVSCPKCGQVDVIRIWKEKNIIHKDCVNCDYHDRLDQEKTSQTSKIPIKNIK